MASLLVTLAQNLDRLGTHESLQDALDELEGVYDALEEQEQELADRLMDEIHRRLRQLNESGKPPATDEAGPVQARYYSMRRLNPLQGCWQVVEVPGLRATSIDGRLWRIQQHRVNRFVTVCMWRSDDAATRPYQTQIQPLVDALSRMPSLPFPGADHLELWLLDGREHMPLAILDTAVDAPPPMVEHRPVWNPFPFSGSGPIDPDQLQDAIQNPEPAHAGFQGQLKRCVQSAAGPSPAAQWFLRDEAGNGRGDTGYNLDPGQPGRLLTAEEFPALLIREESLEPDCIRLLWAYYEQHAASLLLLQGLAREMRDRLERIACRHPEALHRVRHVLPEIVNEEPVRVALVQAVLRRS